MSCTVVSVPVTLLLFVCQFYFVSFIAGEEADGQIPTTMGLILIAFLSIPVFIPAFLISLFAGIRWAVFTLGWVLASQLLLATVMLVKFCVPAKAASAEDIALPLLDQNTELVAAALVIVVAALALLLVKQRHWATGIRA